MAEKIVDSHSYDDTKYAGLISEVLLPGQPLPYQVHDPDALHDISELGLDSAIVFGGVVANEGELATKFPNPTQGTVVYIQENDREVIWVVDEDEAGHWEDFGQGVSLDHAHDVTVSGNITLSKSNTLTGTATVTGTNSDSDVSGSAAVTGHNTASAVSASGSVEVPTVSSSKNYLKLTNETETFVKSYPGSTQKLITTSVTPAGSATDVIGTITPNTTLLAGVSGSTTASKVTSTGEVSIASAGTAVKVPNISVSSATVVNEVTPTNKSFTNMSATVSGTCLVFSSANVDYVESVAHTDTTVGSATKGTDISIVPAVAGGKIPSYTITDVTVPIAADAQTVVTGVQSTNKSVATVGDAVSVATGKLGSAGAGDEVMIGLGTAATASAIKTVALGAGSTSDVYSGETVSVGKTSKDITVAGTAEAQVWTQDTGTISGTAAAQTWTQKTGTASVSGTVSVSGNASLSGTTGSPNA